MVTEADHAGSVCSSISVRSKVAQSTPAVLSDVAGRKPAIITGAVAVVVGGALQTGAYHLWSVHPMHNVMHIYSIHCIMPLMFV